MIGVFVKCPHPEMIEAIGLSGFDAAVVDMEHTPLTPRCVYPLVLAAERRRLDLIVRVPNQDEPYLKWLLDLGVSFVQIPHITCSEQIKSVVKLSFFSPVGERGLCRFVRAANFSVTPVSDYMGSVNKSTRMIFQVEGVEGVKNINSILDVCPAGSILFIGPYDLSQSIGRPGDIWHDDVVDLMLNVVQEADKRNIEVGTFTDSSEGIKFWKKNNIKLIEYGSDLNIFIEGSKKLLNF